MESFLIHAKEIGLAFFMLFFVAVMAWVFLANPRKRFEADAQIPFHDEEVSR